MRAFNVDEIDTLDGVLLLLLLLPSFVVDNLSDFLCQHQLHLARAEFKPPSLFCKDISDRTFKPGHFKPDIPNRAFKCNRHCKLDIANQTYHLNFSNWELKKRFYTRWARYFFKWAFLTRLL